MWETVAFALISAVVGFAAGMRKLKSNCCCFKCEMERDPEGHPQALTVRRKVRTTDV